jgi:dTDP-4-amino-4,6-dideoxygalactose transaminase
VTVILPDQAPAVLGGDPAFPDGLPLTRVHLTDRAALYRRIDSALDSGRLTNGPLVRELEEAAAALMEVSNVVAVASCTAGLMLVLQAIGARGPVVMPSFTFSATAHAATWAGGEPVFADCDPVTLTLDPGDALAALPGASALMATHVYGTPCEVEHLERIADRAGVPLLFDAAHAMGSMRRGRPVGSFGAAEVFSMSPTKVAVAGEGGLVTTDDASLAEAVRLGRDYGNPGDYDCRFPGLNARMSELHAAVALGSLAALPDTVRHRGELAAAFHAGLAGVPGVRYPRVDSADVSTYKDLTILVDAPVFGLDAPQLAAALQAEGVDTRRYFHPPVHRQRAYAWLTRQRKLPVTDVVSGQVLTLPLWSHMDLATIRRLADTVVGLHEHAAAVRTALG